MKRILGLALGITLGCSDGMEPELSAAFAGSYILTAIDGNPLPQEVVIDDEPTPVLSGELAFTPPNFISVSLVLGEPGGMESQSVAVAGPYRLAGPDSAVFPILPAPQVFLRRTGSTVVLVTRAEGAGVGPARLLGGSHRFTFVEE